MRVLPLRIVLTLVGSLLLPPSPGFGETGSVETQPAVGHISHVEGSVTRLHRYVSASARAGIVLLAGDEVHVAMGRAEITLTDGSALQLDEHTRVAVLAVDRVQVLGGRVFVRSSGSGALIVESGGRRLHVMPASDVEVTAANGHDLLVRVVEGDARIESSWGSEAVTATQSAFVSGPTGRPFVAPWVASPHDVFHQWAGGRPVVLVPPAAFLPYAHPTYRQQEYARLVRSQRFERRPSGGFTHRDRADDTERRGHRRERKDRQAAPPEASRPPATPPAAVKPRVPTVGKVVRRP
jgi:hypothetical protein